MKRSSFFMLFLVVVLSVMVGCKSQQSTIGTTTKNDSIVVRTEYVYDTTYIEKIREVIKTSDTVYVHDSVILIRYSDRTKTDTLYRYHSDTIQIVDEKIIEVPRGSEFIYKSGIVCWCVIGAILLAIVIYVVWKIAKGQIPFLNLFSKIFKWL